MLPRFANPHFLNQSTQIVSRADLDNIHDVSRHETEEDDDGIVATLETLVKRSLGDFHVMSAKQENTSPERKRKRRKIESDEGKDDAQASTGDEVVSFRLLSSSTKLFSLRPKPLPVVKATELAYEDNVAEADLRARRAKAAAVEVSWIIQQSQIPIHPRPNDDKKLIHVTLDTPINAPALMVAELSRLPPVRPLSTPKLPKKIHPSPHGFSGDGICCPVVSVTVDAATPKKKPRYRKKTQPPAHRPPPAFWRPLQEWAGKSMGYAMGYEGSEAVPIGGVRQRKYRRDKMRTGVLSI